MKEPITPENSPYSENQRVWLAGFFAGTHSHMQRSADSVKQADARVLHILYGTQTGNAESVANDTADKAKTHGLLPMVKSMDDVEIGQLPQMTYLLIITSTYGDGAMPDNAQLLWDAANSANAPWLDNVNYSVLALGDTSYDQFCQAGIDWDNRLQALGAKRLFERMNCDVDFETPAEKWISEVIPLMAEGSSTVTIMDIEPHAAKPAYNRKNPFPAKMTVNRILTAFGLIQGNPPLRNIHRRLRADYEAGDALCVIPRNCPALVADILRAIHCTGDEDEPVNGEFMKLSEALRIILKSNCPARNC